MKFWRSLLTTARTAFKAPTLHSPPPAAGSATFLAHPPSAQARMRWRTGVVTSFIRSEPAQAVKGTRTSGGAYVRPRVIRLHPRQKGGRTLKAALVAPQTRLGLSLLPTTKKGFKGKKKQHRNDDARLCNGASCLQIAYKATKRKGFTTIFIAMNPYCTWWDVRGSNPRQTD